MEDHSLRHLKGVVVVVVVQVTMIVGLETNLYGEEVPLNSMA